MNNCRTCSWDDFRHKLVRNKLSVLCLNMRSVRNKFAELEAHLALLKQRFSFILVTETWLSPDRDFVYELDGYKSLSSYRDGRGGGMKLFYLKHLDVTLADDLNVNSSSSETMFIRLNLPRMGKITIGCFYRPPSSNMPDFINALGNILNSCGNSRTILMGDFNINVCSDATESRDYVDLFTSYGFSNVITTPTYVSPSLNAPTSCLDHILHNIPLSTQSYVLSPPIADHLAVACIFNDYFDESPIVTKFRDFGDGNCSAFKENLATEFLAFSPPRVNVNTYAIYLEKFLRKMLDKYFPLKTKTLSLKRIRSPWMTSDVLFCVSKKHKLHRKAKNGEISWSPYKAYCALLRKLLDTAEKEYYIHKLNQLGADSRKNWALLNRLLNKGAKCVSKCWLSIRLL